ncbi:cytidine deaminase [Streptomyces kronopolitis]|uniref:Cytidine deaminase n=1 Tax=Streptomyces kronopolitis TaxID=1612435 RepID=A0ABQ2JYP8_9ACTN|nr:cytidine deaminase [Streptomyces kronopolitis]
MTTQLHHVDRELIEAAADVARTRCRGDNHTMAAAARARDGRIVTAVNAYHFTGGPCAELVLIGAAAAQGAYELDTIVAVGDRDRGVVPPCGRCRQVLFDYFPTLKVIVGAGKRVRAVPVADLLPHTYVWADHQIDETDQIDMPDVTDQFDRIGDRQAAEPGEQGPQSPAS